MSNRLHRPLVASLALLLASGLAHAQVQNNATVTFDNGPEGWSINGLATVSASGGAPGSCIHWNDPVDTFGIAARTSTHPAFVGDYTLKGDVALRIGFQVDYIQFFATPVPRDLVVILYDDDAYDGAPPAAVWKHLGTLQGGGMPWTNFTARVEDVLSDALPAGWEGAGDEDPVTFEPILPAGRTYANVLRGVDRVEFTTYVPGFFYGFTHFDVRIDNVRIAPLSGATWTNLGDAHPGAKGEPFLTASGDLAGGSPNSIALQNAAPSAFSALLWSTTSSPVPFVGGTLVPTRSSRRSTCSRTPEGRRSSTSRCRTASSRA
ncbi:MAG: hypothetical protein R3F34_15330 [Planctomycetota bacterium]